jgi:AraC-like DNA-binding protein
LFASAQTAQPFQNIFIGLQANEPWTPIIDSTQQRGLELPGPQASPVGPGFAALSPGHGAQDMVSPIYLAPIIAEAAHHHVDLHALFRGLDIEASDLDVPGTMISHGDAIKVVRRALQRRPIAELGIALGQRATVTERGALALGLLAAATLSDAIGLALRFPRSAGYLLKVQGASSDGLHQFIVEPFPGDYDLQRFLVDLTFSASVHLRRQVTMAEYSPTVVELVSERPANAADHEAFYGCPVRFGCLKNILSVQASWDTFPLPWANVMASRLSLQLLEQESARLNSMPAVGFAVERAIRRRLPEVADLAQVAESLHLSERTLRRRLSDIGLSYRHLLDESRKSRALELMTGGQRPLGEVALACGFSDIRAFARAFKRWTGHPPSLIHGFVVGSRHDSALDRG